MPKTVWQGAIIIKYPRQLKGSSKAWLSGQGRRFRKLPTPVTSNSGLVAIIGTKVRGTEFRIDYEEVGGVGKFDLQIRLVAVYVPRPYNRRSPVVRRCPPGQP